MGGGRLGVVGLLALCACGSGALVNPSDAGNERPSIDAESQTDGTRPPTDAGPPEANDLGDADLSCVYEDDASSGDAADGDDGGPCPALPPVIGSPCDVPSYFCEYGRNWWSRCNLLVTCDRGAWTSFDAGGCDEFGAAGVCPAETCPATWTEAVAIDGGPCPASSCQYPEGDCVCGSGNGGSATACPPAGWSCLPRGPDCASPRPRFGTRCSPGTPSTPCLMEWACWCGQTMYCNSAEGIWVGGPYGQPCKQ